jgi:hypothetical protein
MTEHCKYTFKLIYTNQVIEYDYNPLLQVSEFLKITKKKLSKDWDISNTYIIQIVERKYGEMSEGNYIEETNTSIMDKFGLSATFYVRITISL